MKHIYSIFYKLREIFQKMRSTVAEVSLGDLLMPRDGEMSGLQFIVAARALDVEHYYSGDKSFYFQTVLSSADNPSYNSQHGREIFTKIIQSFESKGYDQNTPPLLVNRKLELIDGTHRISMCLWQKSYDVLVQVTPIRANIVYPDHVYGKKISSQDVAMIRNYYPTLCERLLKDGCALCCKVYGANYLVEDFVRDLEGMVHYFHVARYISNDDLNTANVLITYSLTSPRYVLRGKRIVSERVIEIEKLLRNRYKGKSINILFSKNSTEGKAIFDANK